MREAKNQKQGNDLVDPSESNSDMATNNNFNTLPGVDADLGGMNQLPDNSQGNPDNAMDNQNQQAYGQDFNQMPNQDPNGMMYGQDFNQMPNQDPNGMMYGQDFNQMPNQDPNGMMYGQDFNQVPNQDLNGMMYGQDFNQVPNQDPNGMMYGQDFNQMPNQDLNAEMYGQDFNQIPNQDPNAEMYGQNFNQMPNQDPNAEMYGQDFNQMPNQDPNAEMYGQDFNPIQPQDINQSAYEQNSIQEPDQYNFDNTQSDDMNIDIGSQDYMGDEFAKTWMGPLYNEINSKKFNLFAALSQGIYLLYRKMYLTGSLVLILEEIVILLALLLVNVNVALAIVAIILMGGLYFAGMGLGFNSLYKSYVNKKYKEASVKVQDPSQLNDIARKKGGTSIIGIVIGIVILVIIAVVYGVLVFNQNKEPHSNPPAVSNTTTDNTVANTAVDQSEVINDAKFSLFDNYYLTYDANEWTANLVNNELVKGEYTLVYKINYNAKDLNTDFNSQESLNALLEMLVKSFTDQVAKLNMQVNAENDNFISMNNCYYAYFDVQASDSISRYYFVALPNDGKLIQLVLTGTGSSISIDYSTNLEVIDMIVKIQKDSLMTGQNNSLNTIGNTLSNGVSNNNQDIDMTGTRTQNKTGNTATQNQAATNNAETQEQDAEANDETQNQDTTEDTGSEEQDGNGDSNAQTNTSLSNFINQ